MSQAADTMTTKTVHMFNSTFTLHSVGNDFDCLARVVRIDENGKIGCMLPTKQVLCYIDHSSLQNLCDAITTYLSLTKLPAKEAFDKMKELYSNG